MNNERAALRGHIANLKEKMNVLDIECKGLRLALREKIGSFISSEALDGEFIAVTAARIAETVASMKELRAKITDTEEQLNG